MGSELLHGTSPTGCRDVLRKVKDAPRLLARLQSLQSLPETRDFSLLLDSLANMLQIRRVRVVGRRRLGRGCRGPGRMMHGIDALCVWGPPAPLRHGRLPNISRNGKSL